MNRRTFLSLVFLSGIVLFGLTSLGTLYGYVLPRPNLVNLGPVANFPPRDSPYFIRSKKPVFVVNTGENFLVLVAVPPHHKACIAWWMAEDKKYMDPCLGSQFYLDGTYILGPPPRNMDQYAYQIDNGDLLVNFDKKILGQPHP